MAAIFPLRTTKWASSVAGADELLLLTWRQRQETLDNPTWHRIHLLSLKHCFSMGQSSPHSTPGDIWQCLGIFSCHSLGEGGGLNYWHLVIDTTISLTMHGTAWQQRMASKSCPRGRSVLSHNSGTTLNICRKRRAGKRRERIDELKSKHHLHRPLVKWVPQNRQQDGSTEL